MNPIDPTLPDTGNPGEASAGASPAVSMMNRSRLLQQQQQAAFGIEQAKEQTAQNQTNRALAGQTAAGDAAQWAQTPGYSGVPFSAAPPEVKQHFIDAYATVPGGANGVADELPQIWNTAQRNATGNPNIGLEGLQEGQNAVVDMNGSKVSVGKPPKVEIRTDPTTGKLVKYDSSTGDATFIEPKSPSTGGSVDAPISNTGDELLQTLDPKTAATIKSIAEGRQSLNIFPTRGNQRANAAALVQQYDPTADATTLPTRQATRIEFTKGSAGNAIRSGNTAIEHLNQLTNFIPNLNNTGYKAFNAGKNLGAEWLTNEGSQALGQFNAQKTALAEELSKFFGGKGGTTVSSIKAWTDSLNPNDPPDTIRKNISAIIGALGSQMGEYQSQYEGAMGKSKDIPFIQPETVKILRELRDKGGIDTSGLEDFEKRQNGPQGTSSQAAQSVQPVTPAFKTPEAVRDAYRAGSLPRDQAEAILKKQFGHQ